MSEIPIGVVTFLFSDIEGSTALWENDADAMRGALVAHDELAQSVIAGHSGTIFKHTGDGFAAVFAQPAEALSAAYEFESRLPKIEPLVLKSRMGLHTGHVIPRNGDYFGPEVNRAARVMDAGNGGQIVLSAATAAIVRDDVPDGTSLVDLGEHRLKDLGEPVQIFRLLGGDGADERALRTLEAAPNNLPLQISSFVGREDEVREVATLVDEARLTTLTGIGGVGKTRLSLQVGAELLDEFRDGVWFLELAGLTEPGLIPQTALVSLRLKTDQARPAMDQLIDELSSKHLLLIVDNCEHLIDDVAKFVDLILRSAVDVRVLATSREGLAISGERLWRVPSLATDGESSAIELFAERARLVRPDFAVDDSNRELITELCARLDGIPLAIELATARLNVLDVEQIAEHLADRFRLLTGGSRTSVERQRTLLAMMNWSYELLTELEQALLRRLAVFVGGFDLDAAVEVASGESLPRFDVIDLLGRLVETSLVTFDEGPIARYRLLETVRQYGIDKLAESGEADEARRKHANWFGNVADEIQAGLNTDDSDPFMARSARELANMRAAMTWAYEADEIDVGLRIAVGLRPYFYNTAALDEAVQWIGRGVDRIEVFDSTNRVRALGYAITDSLNIGDDSPVDAWSARAETIRDEITDDVLRADLTNALGNRFVWSDPAQADEQYAAAIDLYRRAGSDRWVFSLTNRFLAVYGANDTRRAEQLFQLLREANAEGLGASSDEGVMRAMVALIEGEFDRCEALVLALDHDSLNAVERGFCYSLLAEAYARLGRLDEAERYANQSSEWFDDSSIGRILRSRSFASVYMARGDAAATLEVLGPIMSLTRSDYSRAWQIFIAVTHARIAASREDFNRCALLVGFEDQMATRYGLALRQYERLELDEIAEAAQQAIGAEDFSQATSNGAATPYTELPLYTE